MPLPTPAPRHLHQNRNIPCAAYQREDGLWDIEGKVLDTHNFDFTTAWGREVPTGTPMHEISLRWTIGADLTIREVAASMDAVPYPPVCPNALPPFQQLVGLTVGRGFLKEVRARIARSDGCTHLFTVIEDMANMAMRSVAAHVLTGTKSWGANVPEATDRPSPLLNTCHAYSAPSPVAKILWPAFYTGPQES